MKYDKATISLLDNLHFDDNERQYCIMRYINNNLPKGEYVYIRDLYKHYIIKNLIWEYDDEGYLHQDDKNIYFIR